ncbi:MAG: peptidase, imelysin family protein, partial [Gammaproteobacteria bacterium]
MMKFKKLAGLSAGILAASLLGACGGSKSGVNTIDVDDVVRVLENNADIAYAAYSDSVTTAIALEAALKTFRENPTQANFDAAKIAWLVAREPYGQTEVYRFRNSPIDSTDYATENGPEGDINAWPLGEALIDAVVTGGDFGTDQIGVTEHSVAGIAVDEITVENHTNNNIIAQTDIEITSELLSNTATAEDERDVISGYHAIEFLLWGQDLKTADDTVTNGDDR